MRRNIPRTLCYAATVLFAVSCDVVEDDQLPTVARQIEMHVAPNKSATIDVRNIIPDLTSVAGTGTANVSYFGNRYVQYNLKGTNGDRFSFEARSTTAKIQTDVNISPFSNSTACEDSGAFTYAKIANNSALVVNLFNNAEFCGFDPSQRGNGVSIAHGMPGDVDINTEGLLLAVCACGGSSAILTYVPPAGFVGQVKFTYRLGVLTSGMSFNDPDIMDPNDFRYYSAHEAVIDVTAP